MALRPSSASERSLTLYGRALIGAVAVGMIRSKRGEPALGGGTRSASAGRKSRRFQLVPHDRRWAGRGQGLIREYLACFTYPSSIHAVSVCFRTDSPFRYRGTHFHPGRHAMSSTRSPSVPHPLRVAVVGGGGHVGLPLGLFLCDVGHSVTI